MRTIFITSFHPHISRNILSTEVLNILQAQKDLQVVLIVPDYKQKYFEDNFGGGNVIARGVPVFQSTKFYRGVFFKRLAMFLMDTETARLRRRFKYYSDKKILYFWFSNLMGFIGRFFFIRRFFRFLDLQLSPKGFFHTLIDEFKPDFIFSTDPQNDNDVSLMQDARARNLPILGMIRSWDNTTQRIFRVYPDKMLVGSDILKEELVKWHGYSENKIVVTGNPHYDRYLKAPLKSREGFFKSFGLDLNKKLILYCPVGDLTIHKTNDMDQYVLEVLKEIPNVQILVRFPPDENVRLVNFVKPDNMIFHRPGHVFSSDKFTDREIRKEDDESLIDQIYYSSLVVTGPTSIALDSCLMDKPVIAVNFYSTERNFFDTVYQYHYNHMQKLLSTGGVFGAVSKVDFLKKANEYLMNPALDKEGRAKARDLWFSRADGHSGKRVANAIMDFMKINND